jgi:hypothetical protein
MDVTALGMHVLGVVLFMAGIGWAIRELTISLTPPEEERACLDMLTAQPNARLESEQKLTLAKAA